MSALLMIGIGKLIPLIRNSTNGRNDFLENVWAWLGLWIRWAVNWCRAARQCWRMRISKADLWRCGTQVVQKKMKQWVLKMDWPMRTDCSIDLDRKDMEWKSWLKSSRGIGLDVGGAERISDCHCSEPSADGERGNPADGAINSGLLRRFALAMDSSIMVYTTRLDTILAALIVWLLWAINWLRN